MVFSNAAFLFLFLPVAVLVYYSPLCRHLSVKNVWLLLVSLVFYAWGEPVYVAVMVCSILANYLFGRLLTGRQQTAAGKWVVAVSCVYNLGVLFICKYLVWVLGLFGYEAAEGSLLSNLSLPIGISFYTFQAMSYVIDVYRGKEDPQKNILHVGLYIAFFPQLIAGPIVRYGDIARQIKERAHTWDGFYAGVWRFAIGLAKKMLIANQVASLAEVAFGMNADERSVLLSWLGALAYTLQIYFDFSGYSDMAIGLAGMFGFKLLENFHFPYISRSITEFWRRWHISLTNWFRDYLYIPLGGNQRGYGKWIRNFFLVWLLTGIWHGANWTFIVWGLAQGVVSFIERKGRPLERHGISAVFGFIYTFAFTMLSWTMFNSDSLTSALAYYSSLFGLAGNVIIDDVGLYWLGQYGILLTAGLLFSFPILSTLKTRLGSAFVNAEGKKEKCLALGSRIWNGGKTVILFMLVLVCFAQAISGDYNPFIYFNF